MKANFTPSQKDYKNITPFKLFVIDQFPFIEANFDAITEWQLFQEIGGKLNEIIKNMYNVTDNTKLLYNSYIALENYVNDYFDNLDVQDEINNKLNEMAQDGTLQEIITSYIETNALLIFNNVNEMKQANNLINGSKCKTLGYYSVNDGGCATYLIRNITNNDVVDNGSLIPLNNQNLVAELIVENVVNVKQFGAKGNGETNDTIPFKNMYSFVSNKIGSDFKGNTLLSVELPNGEYVINETIEIPIYIKTTVKGTVILLSNVSNGATIRYTSNGLNKITSGLKYLTNGSFVDGSVLDSTSGNLIIQRTNNIDDINSNNNSIGILIGDDVADRTKINLSRCHFNDVTISGFKKALCIKAINTYLLTFNNIHTENDYYGVFIDGEQNTNSGENISFNNCIFSHHYHAIYNNYNAICELNFNQCSFDFNANHVLQNEEGNSIFNFNGCHFEGVGYSDNSHILANEINTPGFSSIAHRNTNNPYSKCQFIFDNCYIHLNTGSTGKHLFTALKTTNSITKNCFVKIKNYGLSWSNDKLNFDNRFMGDENVEIELSSPKINNAILPFMGSNLDSFGRFNHFSNDLSGDYRDETFKSTFDNLGYQVLANTWSGASVDVSIDTTNKIFEKSILVQQNALNNTTYCGLARVINNLPKNYIANTCYFKVGNVIINDTSITEYKLIPQIKYKFYDKNENLISELNININNPFENNGWVCSTSIAKVPINACKCVVSATVVLKNNENNLAFKGSIIFGGIISEYMD